MKSLNSQAMSTGYEESRFESKVDENLRCVICTEVLKDPVQCRRNEHHFCKNCIIEHLKHSKSCPTCQDPLTVDTLVKPQRFLANTLSGLKISCDNAERGCRKVVELGLLNTHVVNCDFSPVPCSNDQCDEIINRRDKEIHENKICEYRQVKCDYCTQMVLYKNFMQHTCAARREIREIKAELREIRSKQDKMFKMMENMMLGLTRPEQDQAQRTEAGRLSDDQKGQAEIVVAGGYHCKSVEVFNMRTKIWWIGSEMNECRHAPSSVLYQGSMIVTGGFSGRRLDSIEQLNLTQQHRQWMKCQFKLPMESQGHACVVYQNCLLVIGGAARGVVYDTIYEIQLIPPYTSRLLTKMPKPLCFHGAVVVNNKIYIIGGSTTIFAKDSTNTVLMFDPVTNTFTELQSLPYSVSRTAKLTWKDNVVLLGGLGKKRNFLNNGLLYNVAEGNSCMLPKMKEKRYGCTEAVIGDNIVVIGGKDTTNTDLSCVECYNFDTNKWTEFPSLTERRHFSTAVVKYY